MVVCLFKYDQLIEVRSLILSFTKIEIIFEIVLFECGSFLVWSCADLFEDLVYDL